MLMVEGIKSVKDSPSEVIGGFTIRNWSKESVSVVEYDMPNLPKGSNANIASAANPSKVLAIPLYDCDGVELEMTAGILQMVEVSGGKKDLTVVRSGERIGMGMID